MNDNKQKTKVGRKNDSMDVFKRLTSESHTRKHGRCYEKETLREKLLIAAQNNAMRTNHIKVRTDDSWYCHQRIGTKTGGLGNNGTSGNGPNYSIVENGQNTEKGVLEA